MTRWDNYGELYHHGIKGQKWGIRRYQNEDGTLTEEGKKRYYSGYSGDFEKEKYLEDTTAQSEKELTQENLGKAGSAARTALIGTLAAKTLAKTMLGAGAAAEQAAIASNAMITGVNAAKAAFASKAALSGLAAITTEAPLINAGSAAVAAMLGTGAYMAIPIAIGGIVLNTAIVATVNHFASKEKGYKNFTDQVNEKVGKKAANTGEWDSEKAARADAREFTYYKKKLNQASNGSYNGIGRSRNDGYRYGFGGM